MKKVIKKLYWYSGPIYRFGKDISSQISKYDFPIKTEAVSVNQAYSNITYKLKILLGLDPKNTKITIDKGLIDYVIDDKFAEKPLEETTKPDTVTPTFEQMSFDFL